MNSQATPLSALHAIAQSCSRISDLPFTRTTTFSDAVLCSTNKYVSSYIREARPSEAALFTATDADREEIDPTELQWRRERVMAAINGNKTWEVGKRPAPTRKKAVVPSQPNFQDQDDAKTYIDAALQLLEVYPLKRAKEHVKLLQAQYEGLIDSIHDLEEQALAKPNRKTKLSTRPPEQVEADIRKEELEILALTEMLAEQQKELIALDEQMLLRKQQQQQQRQAPPPSVRQVPPPSVRKIARSPSPPSTLAASTTMRPIAPPEDESMQAEDTPKAVRVAPPMTPLPQTSPAKSRVSPQDIATYANKVWVCMGDSLAKYAASTDRDTAATNVALEKAIASTTDIAAVEFYLLFHFLTILQSPSPLLPIHFRAPLLSSSDHEVPMLGLEVLKSALGEFANGKGLDEGLATKAVYGLVAKRLLKIDRRGKEALVGFVE